MLKSSSQTNPETFAIIFNVTQVKCIKKVEKTLVASEGPSSTTFTSSCITLKVMYMHMPRECEIFTVSVGTVEAQHRLGLRGRRRRAGGAARQLRTLPSYTYIQHQSY